MIARALAAALAVVTAASGCLRSGAFRCDDNMDCMRGGTAGVCESVGFCSFADPSCGSGQRFGNLSGGYANQCVGEALGDAMLPQDGPQPDGSVTPPDGLGCPSSYAPLAGGSAHVYRHLEGQDNWMAKQTACQADGANAYLAVPDDASELDAILTLSGANSWVGIEDIDPEGVYVTVLGAPATFLPWVLLQPDNLGNSDCVVAIHASRLYDDRKCNATFTAVCECEP
ncbi:MAG: C-type lectin domain-containing protein [Kofleriaceae bacterium]